MARFSNTTSDKYWWTVVNSRGERFESHSTRMEAELDATIQNNEAIEMGDEPDFTVDFEIEEVETDAFDAALDYFETCREL